MMKKFYILAISSLLIVSNAFLSLSMAEEASEAKADEKIERPFDCVTELMSRPSCINRLNATRACKMFGGSPEAVKMIQKCVEKQGFHGGVEVLAPTNIIALCLAGISSSNKVSDNETYCKVGDIAGPEGTYKYIGSNNLNTYVDSTRSTTKKVDIEVKEDTAGKVLPK